MLERNRIALSLLTQEHKNARQRQHNRERHASPYQLAGRNTCVEISYHLRKLRQELGRLDRLEKRERAYRERELRKALHNQNRAATGTYGK